VSAQACLHPHRVTDASRSGGDGDLRPLVLPHRSLGSSNLDKIDIDAKYIGNSNESVTVRVGA
jgi:hypothetical protein